jgi:AbiV family abortive infection protein
MRTKAIKDLGQLSDTDFFHEVSIGLEHILNNALRLENDANILHNQKCPQGYRILRGMAEEEAAKFLILIDAVRCPRNPPEVFIKQLKRFNDHLAKGIYAEYFTWRPATFGEVVKYIEDMRREYYLDGPNDIDWIFRNRVLQGREETIYVDYAETDEGHSWIAPRPEIEFLLISSIIIEPEVLAVARAIKEIGCTNSQSLKLMADTWRPIKMAKDFHWQDLRQLNAGLLEKMKEAGLLIEQPQETYNKIIDNRLFPLYSVDLGIISVNRKELKEMQDRWAPF